jgi:hypothetical protein
MPRPDWEEKTQAAFETYIAALKAELGPDASIAEMEAAILKHSPGIMRTTLESMAASQDFSPSAKGRS